MGTNEQSDVPGGQAKPNMPIAIADPRKELTDQPVIDPPRAPCRGLGQGPDPDQDPLALRYAPITTSPLEATPQDPPPQRSKTDQHSTWLKNLQKWRTSTYNKPSKTLTYMARENLSRDLFNAAIRSTSYGITDTGCKQVLQALCGTFPTRHKLWLQGRFHTPFCPFCPTTMENMTHWQCLCPQFHDSRTAAHNYIWNALASLLQKHSPLTIQLEHSMADTPLQVDGRYRNWRPDGIAWNHSTNSIFLLEFTCSDNRNSEKLLPWIGEMHSVDPSFYEQQQESIFTEQRATTTSQHVTEFYPHRNSTM
jgi:hypothetical protein